MKKVTLAKANYSLAEYTRLLQGEPLVVTEAGKPVAVLLPIEGLDLEQLAIGTSPAFLDLIERSRRRHESAGISTEEMCRRLELPLPKELRLPAKRCRPKPKTNEKKKPRQVNRQGALR